MVHVLCPCVSAENAGTKAATSTNTNTDTIGFPSVSSDSTGTTGANRHYSTGSIEGPPHAAPLQQWVPRFKSSRFESIRELIVTKDCIAHFR